jgi:acid phosphatase family membrane protein YuiD
LVYELLTNQIFLATVVALVICQVWKTVHSWVEKKKMDLKEIYSTGGMPSSHTTLVTAMTISVGFQEGFASALFIVALFVSMVIIRDALGVRRTVDDLIRYVNRIVREKKIGLEQIIKIAGHTPVQVFVGLLLGAAVAIMMHFVQVM